MARSVTTGYARTERAQSAKTEDVGRNSRNTRQWGQNTTPGVRLMSMGGSKKNG